MLPFRRRAVPPPAPAVPRSDPAVTDRPALCDWAWRPSVWAASQAGATAQGTPGGHVLGPGCKLFHDDPGRAVSVRQHRTPDGPAPCALEVAAGAFAGSYLSLAIDLPEDAARSTGRGSILRVTARLAEPPAGALYARLNLRLGPNTDALTERLRSEGAAWRAELDLGFTGIAPGGVDAAWLDLSVDAPAETRLEITDLTLTRRPRAEL